MNNFFCKFCNDLCDDDPYFSNETDSIYMKDYLDRTLSGNALSVTIIASEVPKDDDSLVSLILNLDTFKQYRKQNPLD